MKTVPNLVTFLSFHDGSSNEIRKDFGSRLLRGGGCFSFHLSVTLANLRHCSRSPDGLRPVPATDSVNLTHRLQIKHLWPQQIELRDFLEVSGTTTR